MKSSILGTRSFDFALCIIGIYKDIMFRQKEYLLSKQLLRSGTSIGANIREGARAESKADFVHKYGIALKEANECDYWLELLSKSEFISIHQYQSLKIQIDEIIHMLIASIKTAKRNSKQ